MAATVHRVVVRGHFADLTDEQRASLLAEADEHDFHQVTYTEWGTFIYERNLVAFNFRYEVRIADDADPVPDPVDVGLAKATASLQEWGLGHKHLKATATDMSQVWST
ncbi:DUF6204 family protein [Aquihabitans sp. McL0605]|uniref:DUF6204 family protein n=1 Tax=Aquihabitans sp. McL0605 TaxID=3415671 RepID=UPI003CF49C07